MKEPYSLVAALAVLAAIAAPAAAQRPQADRPQNMGSTMSRSTQSFIKDAAAGGQAEISLAQLAESKATDPAVKGLADTIRRDHEAADAELQTIAERKHIALPTTETRAEKNTADRLSKLNGRAFDRAYTVEMVKDHQTDIKQFEQHQKDGDPDVAAWAAKTLPTLRDHLKRSEDAQQAVVMSRER
jgi:putative membrane protein